MSMQKLEYQVRFVTPAFLGNAEQKAQWRTPPFKALLRQWWRIVKSPQVGYDVNDLRKEEARLFGSASDTSGSASVKSKVFVRLDSWKNGTLSQWPATDKVHHPEVGDRGVNIGADLYLGYGPLTFEGSRGTVLGTVRGTGVKRTAINLSAETARLIVRVPEEHLQELLETMQMVACFGALGSRSRNGWGSLEIDSANVETPRPKPLTRSNLEQWKVCRSVEDCLKVDCWPHAIGADGKGPLVWKTTQSSDWRSIVKVLAEIKIKFRTQFSFSGGAGSSPSRRHILAYPVTHHLIDGWGQQGRLANQLRFRVGKTTSSQVEGILFHLPCRVPDELIRELRSESERKFIRENELNVWQAVHHVLDKEEEATRLT